MPDKKTKVTNSTDAMNNASQDIMKDEKRRRAFLADPAAYLKKAGVAVRGHIELSERDKEIITMVADPEVAAIYQRGDIAELSKYLRENYKGLINDPGRVAWTVADFEVAIEAVAIAVGVFVAPIRPPDDFSEVGRLEAVLNARINALEKTIGGLQEQIEKLSHG